MKIGFFAAVILVVLSHCSPSKNSVVIMNDSKENVLVNILHQYPQYFDSILRRKDELKVQIIYTQIDRDRNNKPSFKDFYFNVSDTAYYYPASTVKLPAAILALQKLHELNVAGLGRNSTMITEAGGDGQ